ncbi:MAG: hypothetical protein D3910_01600, partial [Candidatus Electrothrix sp. ATG2]|nr:hypothetical protein [Candidatus Electrothrix sp. ATG2]
EFDNYKNIKREMPRVGRLLNYEGSVYRVVRIFTLQGTVLAVSREKGELLMNEEQWRAAKPVNRQVQKKSKPKGTPKGGSKGGGKGGQWKKNKKDET